MPNKKLALLITLIFLMTTFGLIAQEPVTLVVWDQHGGPADEAANVIYQMFMDQNPGIVIEREVYAGNDLRTLAPTALASGSGPDVVYFDVSPARESFRSGLMLALDDYAEQFGWHDRFFPAGLQWTIIDEQIAALGLEYEFVGVFVNSDLMEEQGFEVPTTLEETLVFCQAASEAGFVPFAHGQNPGWQTYFSFTMPLHNVMGVERMTEMLFGDEADWTQPDVVRAVEIWDRDMRDAGCFLDDVNGLDWQGQQDLFYAGEALLFPTGTWVVGEILENMPGTNVEMVPFMAVEEGGPRVYTTGMGSAFFISSATEHPDEAALFLDFLFSDEAALIWIEQAGFIPPISVDTSDLELESLKGFVLDTLQAAGMGESDIQLGYNVDLVAPQTFNEMMRDGFQAVMAGIKTPEEQLEDLQRLWDEG